MRRRAMPIAVLTLIAAGCAGGSVPRTDASSRVAMMDTTMVRRLCADADSVIAGRRACVLSDQSFRRRDVRKP